MRVVEENPLRCYLMKLIHMKGFRTLGFALAKGLIRGLTRCPNPSSKISLYYPFLDVS